MLDRIYIISFRGAPEWFLKKLDSEILKVGQEAGTDRALLEGMSFQITICPSEESLLKLVQQRHFGEEKSPLKDRQQV